MAPELLAVFMPTLGGMVAVGAVLLIKTRRRVGGTRDPRHTEVVPVRELSEGDARRMWRRYWIAVGLLAVAVLIVALARF